MLHCQITPKMMIVLRITIALTGTEGLGGFWRAFVPKPGFISLRKSVATNLQSGYANRYTF